MLDRKKLATGANAPAGHSSSRPHEPAAANVPFRRTPEDDGATIHNGRPAKAARSKAAVKPEKILQAFNTWAFRREQPDNVLSLLQVISGALQLAQPVPFVLYWGKGPRCGLSEPDTACLDYLAALGSRVHQVYEPGASFKLIFTDTRSNTPLASADLTVAG